MLELEFEEWVEKLGQTCSRLTQKFEVVTIEYTLKNEGAVEVLDEQKFFNLLSLEHDVHNKQSE